jgi:hypothetical protein
VSNLTAHEKTSVRASAADDPPMVEVAIAWSERGSYWAITVERCPFCQGKHYHGGGDDSRPDFGYRLSHCIDRPSRTYEILPAAESGWAA